MANKNQEITENELFDVVEEDRLNPYPPVHTMIRSISRTGISSPDLSFQSVVEVDAEVGAWINAGYKLLNTHFLSENTEAFIVMYVLVRQ